MKYKVVNATIRNDGTVVEGKRNKIILWPCELSVGGLYFLGGANLYRILELVP